MLDGGASRTGYSKELLKKDLWYLLFLSLRHFFHGTQEYNEFAGLMIGYLDGSRLLSLPDAVIKVKQLRNPSSTSAFLHQQAKIKARYILSFDEIG